MSHPAREPAERGAGAPRVGMRPCSGLQGAGASVPFARLWGQIPGKPGPLFRPPTRPILMGIGKASGPDRRRGDARAGINGTEAGT